MAADEFLEWRYLDGGMVAHAFEPASLGVRTVCGLTQPDEDDWLGAGSQDEYEQCASMRRCRNCRQEW